MTLKILSWNILQGGGSRIQSIVNFLLEQNADIICLSEFHNNTNGYFLRSSLLKSGWIHQSTGANAAENNTVFVASKIPFESSYPAKNLDTYQDLMIKANFSAFSLYNNYFPHKKEHKLFDILFEELHSNSNAIIVGDLNTGKNYIDQVGDSFWYQKEFSTLEKNNFIDAFRFFHKEKKNTHGIVIKEMDIDMITHFFIKHYQLLQKTVIIYMKSGNKKFLIIHL